MKPRTRNLIILATIAYHLVCMVVILFKQGMDFSKPILAVMFIPQFIAAYLLAGFITAKREEKPVDELQQGLPGGRPQDRVNPSLAAARAGRKSLQEEADEAFAPVKFWGYRAALALLGIIILWYYAKFVF